MSIKTYYVGFWPRVPLFPLRRRSIREWWGLFGHVEAWGVTEQNTWFFFDPQADGTRLVIDHRHEPVEDMLAERFALCSEILRVKPFHGGLRLPLHPTMTCASQVAHLFALRAFTPWGLRRILLAHGAEVIHGNEGAEGRPIGQGCAPA